MQIAYILAHRFSPNVVQDLQAEVDTLRPDQQAYVAHLLRSWRALEFHDVGRAIKTARAQRP